MRPETALTRGETNTKAVRKLRALKRRLARQFRVDRMILFGSRARGDWLLTRDADVMIVSPDFAGRRFVDRSAEILPRWRGRVDLEALSYTPAGIAARR